MPYKIYTYTDPYRIAETDFWNEISNTPHLCSSRTLVNGLIDVMQDSIASLICPLDEIIDSKFIYRSWTKNVAAQIQQFSYLTKTFDSIPFQAGDVLYRDSLKHNQSSMLKALRLFMELGIPALSLHENAANKEQRLFIQLLSKIQSEPVGLFTFPSDPTAAAVKQALGEKIQSDTEYFKSHYQGNKETPYYLGRIAMYQRGQAATAQWSAKKIVIHGVHQFSPVQLRFIIALEKMGMDVIFLHNYQEDFPAIYSSWDYIYQSFGAKVHRDGNIRRYTTPGQLPTPGHALAEALALMCEDGVSKADSRFKKDFDLYKSMRVKCFDNISEYAGYISDLVDEAKREIDQVRPLYERPLRKISTTSILNHMDELIYTANKDVSDLLELYYPEYSRSRHFLAFPVGQFFVSLYRLWDWKAGEIRIDYTTIRECLNSGILTRYPCAELLKTAINLEPLFENVTYCTEFIARLKYDYLPRYQEVTQAKADSVAFSFRSMTIYQSYKVSQKNIEDFIAAITELNSIAQHLFRPKTNGENFLSFEQHFEALEDFIRARQPQLLNVKEQELIDQLLARFEDVQATIKNTRMGGTFEDLKQGIYFFLKQKEEPDPNWLVKNFEQIDGDILSSRQQNRSGHAKTYHFACVSDRDMNQTINDILPWPLNDQFIERAYTPIDLQFQVYYAALSERSNFLRYCLFYGLFFNRCESQISYVKQYGDEEAEEYDFLRLLGVSETAITLCNSCNAPPFEGHLSHTEIPALAYNEIAMMDMFLCPYRYFFDYVLNPQPSSSTDFLYSALFENVLLERVWKRLAGKPVCIAAKEYNDVVTQERDTLIAFFPFWRNSDVADLKRRAHNYFSHHILTQTNRENRNSTIQPFNRHHIELRKLFGKAYFTADPYEDIAPTPYGHFKKLRQWKEGKFVWSLHNVPGINQKNELRAELLQSTLQYLVDCPTPKNPEEKIGEWCQTCPNKDICLRSYTPQV